MNKDKILMVIVFGVLAFLNMNGYIDINDRAVFGLTLGSLIICISTCFDFPVDTDSNSEKKILKLIWIYKYKIIQNILYSIGFLTMFVVIFMKENELLNRFMDKFDSNTLMLLSIAITFLSISISHVVTETTRNKIRKHYLDLFEEKINNLSKRIGMMGDRNE